MSHFFTGCRVSGAGGGGASGLVPLEDFTYANSFMGCVIQWNLAQTNFLGVSVSYIIILIIILMHAVHVDILFISCVFL